MYDPTVVGGAVPCGSNSVIISSMASAGGSAKHANHGQAVKLVPVLRQLRNR